MPLRHKSCHQGLHIGQTPRCNKISFKLECSSLGLASACVPCTDGMRVHFYTRKDPLYCGSPCAHSRHEIEESMLVTKKKTHRQTHARRQTHANPLCRAPPVFFNRKQIQTQHRRTHTHTHKHTHTHTHRDTQTHTQTDTRKPTMSSAAGVF